MQVSTKTTLYQRLAEHYLQAIQAGALRPGDRFPSVRQLMRLHTVSLSTALQVCRSLEAQGWLEASERAGYFVRRPRAPAPVSEPVVLPSEAQFVGIHAHVSNIIARGQQQPVKLNLALAVGTPEMYPSAALSRLAQRVLRTQPELLTTMARRHGHPALRQALAYRALARGMRVAPEDVVVTHGCTEALNLALRAVTRPGDTVVVESPTFYGFLQLLEALGLRALELPTHAQTGLSLEALAFALEQDAQSPQPRIKAILAMPTLHNPLGCTMPDVRKAELVRLCREHDVALIEDDIYHGMAESPRPIKPAKAWDTTGHVIYCDSLNKILAPGLRLGWMLAGRWHARVEMLKYTQSRYSSELQQLLVAEFLAGAAFDRHVRRLRQTVVQQRAHMVGILADSFPHGTRWSSPDGGLLLWVQLPPTVDSDALFERALAQGIKIAPGSMFSNSPRFGHFIRLSCAAPQGPAMEAGLRELGRLVHELAAEGMARAA